MMRATSFLCRLFPVSSVGPGHRGPRCGGRPVETLEGRLLLAAFAVNTVLDTVDASPGDGLARDAAGRTSLRAAVMEANARPGADSINLPSGTYALTLTGAEENGGRTGDLDITGDLTVVGAGAATTVIDAAGVNDRIFDVPLGGTTRRLSLTGLTLTGGRAIKVADNLGDRGGAIRIDFFNEVTITNCVFTNNASPRTGQNLIFGVGGAIDDAGKLTITGSKFENNNASNSGGAIYVGGTGAQAVIRDCWFTGNTAQAGGGAIQNQELMTIDNSTFSDNHAGTEGSGSGGAIDNNGGGNLTITNSTFSENSSTFGGAVNNFETLKIFSSTIAGNSAFFGGGLSTTGGSLTLKNTIVATNSNSGSGTGPDVEGQVQSQGHNLVGNPAGSTGFSAALGDLLNADPKLGPLADNGGPTPTRALLPGSVAIDAGDPAGAPATDQRGQPRPFGPGVDIGAYEAQSSIQLLAVFARGSSWSAPFKQYLADRGLGDAARGYRINGGDTLPWVNADQLVLQYDRDVPKAPFAGFYTVHGVRSDYQGRLTFLDDRSLLLTFDRPLGDAGGDRFHLTDPFFGGTFDLRFNALPGDTDASGTVLANDLSEVKRRFFTSTIRPGEGGAAYSARHDVDGSGSILANDYSEVKQRFFDALPAVQAAASPAAITARTAPRRRSATGEAFARPGVLPD